MGEAGFIQHALLTRKPLLEISSALLDFSVVGCLGIIRDRHGSQLRTRRQICHPSNTTVI
jgi:hypothetical protein